MLKKLIKPENLIIILLLFIFFIGASVIESHIFFKRTKMFCQNRTVPASILNYGLKGLILKKTCLFDLEYTRNLFGLSFNDDFEYKTAQHSEKYMFYEKLSYRATPCWGKIGSPFLTIETTAKFTDLSHDVFRKNWDVISVDVDQIGLYNKQYGILERFQERGRSYEVPCSVSYYTDKQRIFRSYAGLRLHGGSTRSRVLDGSSFRLYFRNLYGQEFFLPGIKNPKIPIKTLVIHKAACRNDFTFANLMALDISEKIGCNTPEYKPVLFYLNAELMGIYFISEHLSSRQWSQKTGTKDFVFYSSDGRNVENSRKAFADLYHRIMLEKTPLSLTEMKTIFDMDNICKSWLSIIYCSTNDIMQGVLTKKDDAEGSRWKFTIWDMDMSFQYGINGARTTDAYKINSFKFFQANQADLLLVLFSRLLHESPDFKNYFQKKAVACLKKLDKRFLNTMTEKYKQLLRSSKIITGDDFKPFEIFFKLRTRHLYDHLKGL